MKVRFSYHATEAYITFVILFFMLSISMYSQKGKDGPFNVPGQSIVNRYSVLAQSIAPGANSIVVGNINDLSANAIAGTANNPYSNNGLTTCDLLMIIKMQGASINVSNSTSYGSITNYNGVGAYELVEVSSVIGNTITLSPSTPIVNGYTVGLTQRVQVIRVPRITTLSITSGGTLTAKPWSDSNYTGGIVAIETSSTTTINGSLSVKGLGFKGGPKDSLLNSLLNVTDYVSSLNYSGGVKGESIAGSYLDYDVVGGRYCRGAPANGGGGGDSWNAGGGGGSNGDNGVGYNGLGNPSNTGGPVWTSNWNLEFSGFATSVSSGGGRGGYSWQGDNSRSVGGFGGKPLNTNGITKLFFGGGGGSADGDNDHAGGGGNGGGIVYLISYGAVTGTGTISAEGNNGLPAVNILFNDAAGGAGGGGAIVVLSPVSITGILMYANGGIGGNNPQTSAESEGPGGGGGGGCILTTSTTVTRLVNGGLSGTTLSTTVPTFSVYGATDAAAGEIINNVAFPFQNTLSFIPVTSNAPVCSGTTLSLSVSTPTTSSYQWEGPNGFTSNSFNPLINSINPTMSGIYSVTVTSACSVSQGTIDVLVNTTPTISVSRDTSICAGAQITLTANGATSYTWNPGGITGNTFTVSPLVTTSYTVNAMSTGSCIASAVSTATVNPALPLSVNSGTICVGNSFVLNPLGASSYTYSGGSATVTPNVSTTYTITGANAVGCPGSIVSSVVVVPQPSLTVNSGSICSGNSFTITPSGASSYTYSGGISVVSPTTSTTYSIIGTSTLGCLVTNTVISSITVFPLPVLSVNSGTVCESTPFFIVPTGAITYSYSSGSSIVTPTVSTNYSVTGSDISGCVGVVISSVTVIPNPVILTTSNTTSVCSGENTFLNSSGATSYTWSTGQNTASITVNPITSNTYSVVGSYQVGALVCSATQTIFITVNSTLPISVNSGTICTGNSFTLNPVGASSYTYSSGSATVTPNISTTYTITGSNAVGCTGTVTPSVVVVPQPTLTVNSGSICSGNSFTIIPIGASSYTYSGGASVVSPATSTTYSIIGTSTLGCLVTDTVISSISVFPIPVLSVNSGTVCEGTTFTMVPSGAISYSYSSGSSVVSPTVTSTYSVTGSNTSGCVGVVTSTVTVIPKPVIVITSTTTALCSGESTNLNATGATSYTWSTGQNTNSILITPTNSTIYSVVGSNQIGTFICSATQLIPITVTPQTTVAVFGQDSICVGSSTIIYATGATTYTWQPNASVSNPKLSHTSVNPTSTTIYTVTASNNGACPGTGTIQINVNPLPIVYAGRDTTINIDQSYVLHGTGNVDVGFLSPDMTPLICNFCPIVEVYPKTTTCYLLKGLNSHNCMAYDEICIQVTKDWDVYIPNTFTPNGDDLNDSFLPVGYGISNITLSVFDRWGKEIFKSNPPVIGWNGKLNDQLCEQGAYVYQVEITTMSGLTIHKTGHVNLLGQLIK